MILFAVRSQIKKNNLVTAFAMDIASRKLYEYNNL